VVFRKIILFEWNVEVIAKDMEVLASRLYVIQKH